MTWRDQLHLIPTRNAALLASLLGKPITRLAHLAEDPPDQLLELEAYSARAIEPEQLFSTADGPALLGAGDVLLCIGQELPLVSVSVELADEPLLKEDWPVEIAAADPRWSEPRFAALLGRTIVGIRVLQQELEGAAGETPGAMNRISALLLERPREVALFLALAGGGELQFVVRVVDSPNDFALYTEEDALDLSSCVEVLRLPATASPP